MKNLLQTLGVTALLIAATAVPELIVNAMPHWLLDVVGYGLLISVVIALWVLMFKIAKGKN